MAMHESAVEIIFSRLVRRCSAYFYPLPGSPAVARA
jgi:hypothetical protein